MDDVSYTIRAAVLADALALSRLAESTFRDTFSGANSAENMDEHCRNSYGKDIQSSEILDSGIITLVAQIRGCLAGFAQLRPGAFPPSRRAGVASGEIHRFYVTAEHHGKGIAQLLMHESISALRERSCDYVWLGVWERNPRAIAFYRKFGFEEVGDQIFRLGRDQQRDIVMGLSLA